MKTKIPLFIFVLIGSFLAHSTAAKTDTGDTGPRLVYQVISPEESPEAQAICPTCHTSPIGNQEANVIRLASISGADAFASATSSDKPAKKTSSQGHGCHNASVYGYPGDTGSGTTRTATGERVNTGELTVAHRTLPLNSKVRITNVNNGRSVVARVNDRGPAPRSRIVDVTPAVAAALGMPARGLGCVNLN